MDAVSERYALNVASATATVFGSKLVGVYLHGSAVLGGFDARRSDIDILAVCEGPISEAEQVTLARRLGDACLSCPAQGLELSVVTLVVAQYPTARPAFEFHMTTAQADTKVVNGHDRTGDPDLVLHFAVCRQAGRLLGAGHPAAEVFASVADTLVRAQLVTELGWAVEHAPGEYAVLNACRAWRFAADGVLVSKIEGGQWACDRGPDADRDLIRTALDRQRCRPAAGLDPGAVARFVHQTLTHLAEPPPRAP